MSALHYQSLINEEMRQQAMKALAERNVRWEYMQGSQRWWLYAGGYVVLRVPGPESPEEAEQAYIDLALMHLAHAETER